MTALRALGRRRVLIDTSALFPAFENRAPDHEPARVVLDALIHDRTELYTTNFIVAETHTLILRRLDRFFARRFVNTIQASATRLVRVTEADEERAIAIINQYDDKDFSYVDATSFAVMERLGIDEGFSFDRHFRQYGWRMLPERLP